MNVVRKLREKGKKIIIVSPKRSLNHFLKKNCNEFHDYFEVIKELD